MGLSRDDTDYGAVLNRFQHMGIFGRDPHDPSVEDVVSLLPTTWHDLSQFESDYERFQVHYMSVSG